MDRTLITLKSIMQNTLIAYATPVFFILIALEIFVASRREIKVYRLNDSMASLGCGIVTVTLELFLKAALILLFAWVVERYAFIFTDVKNVLHWLIFIVLLDFIYYWFHRWCHEINLLWAVHVPHHQSEEYNLTTALRQGAFQDLFFWPMLLPLALLGCSAEMMIIILTGHKFYQFWIHTRLIGPLPFIEGILNTPSAHRVHHGVNAEYIDRNHGGLFMFWDRLFGTYVKEKDEVVYGVRKPLDSWSPLKAQLDGFNNLWKDGVNSDKWQDRVLILFKPTGWRPESTQINDPREEFDLNKFIKFDVDISSVNKKLALAFFLAGMICNSVLTQWHNQLEQGVLIAIATATIISLWLSAKFLMKKNT